MKSSPHPWQLHQDATITDCMASFQHPHGQGVTSIVMYNGMGIKRLLNGMETVARSSALVLELASLPYDVHRVCLPSEVLERWLSAPQKRIVLQLLLYHNDNSTCQYPRHPDSMMLRVMASSRTSPQCVLQHRVGDRHIAGVPLDHSLTFRKPVNGGHWCRPAHRARGGML